MKRHHAAQAGVIENQLSKQHEAVSLSQVRHMQRLCTSLFIMIPANALVGMHLDFDDARSQSAQVTSTDCLVSFSSPVSSTSCFARQDPFSQAKNS